MRSRNDSPSRELLRWGRLAILSFAFGFAAPHGTAAARKGSARLATITVTSAGDDANGTTSSIAGLLAAPGPDGISLREAIEATNNDPGVHTIRFAPGLTIALGSQLPPLRGGNVTIEGPVTIRGGANVEPTPFATGFYVASSGNRITNLTLERFFLSAIRIAPAEGPLLTGITLSDNTIDHVTVSGSRKGIELTDAFSATCGIQEPCRTHNRWSRTTITDNVVEAERFAIHVDLARVVGDVIDGVTVARNTIRSGTTAVPNDRGAPIQIDIAGITDSARLANVVVSNNVIDAVQAGGDGSITIANGLQRARHSVIEDVRITDNVINVVRPGASVPCCHGIMVSSGSDFYTYSSQLYPGSPDDNVVRRVEVSGNQLVGDFQFGAMRVQAGVDGGGSRNRLDSIQVTGNTIRSNTRSQGIRVAAGDIGQGRTVTGNVIANLDLTNNDITVGTGDPGFDLASTAGIALIAGQDGGRDGIINQVRITNNRITALSAAILLTGGQGVSGSTTPPRGNSLRCIRLQGNTITGATTAVSARANVNGAAENSLSVLSLDQVAVVAPEAAAAPAGLNPVVGGC